MIPVLSPFELLDFAIINCNFSFQAFNDNEDQSLIVNQYPIDVDFAISENEDYFRIFVKVHINQNAVTSFHGYSVFAEGAAVFKFNASTSISNEERLKYLNYSGVTIALNSLRGFIVSLTANAPLGRYTLPTFDINELLLQKTNNSQPTS